MRVRSSWAPCEIMATDLASRTIQQQVKVYHDFSKKKLRLCPMPDNATADTSGYGMLLSTCGKIIP